MSQLYEAIAMNLLIYLMVFAIKYVTYPEPLFWYAILLPYLFFMIVFTIIRHSIYGTATNTETGESLVMSICNTLQDPILMLMKIVAAGIFIVDYVISLQ